MRALLVVNPKATTTSERARNVLVRALRTEMDIQVGETRRRGHAAELARQAARDGLDVVVALGGDGTVNEVVNGLLTSTAKTTAARGPAGGTGPVTALADRPSKVGSRDRPGRDVADEPEVSPAPADQLPAIAVVPGGSANVFARALGLPGDAIEATGALLEAIHAKRTRTVGLGWADGRYFTFCAGYGMDAEVVRKVERARLRGRSSSPALYIRSTLTQLLLDTDRRHQPITLNRPGATPEVGLSTVIVQNTAPWTFIGGKAINACPDASFDTGLDLLALRTLHVPATTLVATNMLTGHRPGPRNRQSFALHDLSGFTLSASRPTAFQLDGEYLGERHTVTFRAVPEAVRVYC